MCQRLLSVLHPLLLQVFRRQRLVAAVKHSPRPLVFILLSTTCPLTVRQPLQPPATAEVHPRIRHRLLLESKREPRTLLGRSRRQD